MNQLFVYGTLMRGEERAGFLANSTARPATIQGQLWRAPAGYPALLLVDGGAEIAGEVVALDNPAILTALDLIEGTSEGLYTRKEAVIQTESGPQRAWVYVMSPLQLRQAGCRPTKATDWRKLTRRR